MFWSPFRPDSRNPAVSFHPYVLPMTFPTAAFMLPLAWLAAVDSLAAQASGASVDSTVAMLPNVTMTAAEVIDLWPGPPPDETEPIGPEHVLENRPRPFDQIADVSVPTLSIFQPGAEKRTGTGILVIPGGGLERLAIETEGYEVAHWLNENGITAFLLKYRVPPRDPDHRWKAGLQDAQRAMSLIRARADAWQVDRDAIGAIGFSAGGELNVRLSVFANERQYDPIDAADTFPTRPDFNIPIYTGGIADFPADTLRPDIASRLNAHTPPMFIVHADDDASLSSIILMDALKRANIASELHIFAAGAHGFGVRDTGLPLGAWRELCLHWLRWQGYLDTAGVRAFARDFLQAHETDGATWPRFGDVVPAGDLTQAFAAQKRIVRATLATGDAVAGYKGAFTSASAQSSHHLEGPLHGVLFRSGRIKADGIVHVELDPARPILVETEIGYVIAVDIGTKLRLPRQARTAVEAMVPAIELPNNVGLLSGGNPSALDLVAANVGSNRFIIGAPVDPRKIPDPDAVPVTLRRQGELLHTTSGADAAGGQAENLMRLINQIVEQGHVLHHGDVIISGSLGGARPGQPGAYAADFGPLGRIEFTLD